jgi:hypothetical protein
MHRSANFEAGNRAYDYVLDDLSRSAATDLRLLLPPAGFKPLIR